jgi:hypothetical protein
MANSRMGGPGKGGQGLQLLSEDTGQMGEDLSAQSLGKVLDVIVSAGVKWLESRTIGVLQATIIRRSYS